MNREINLADVIEAISTLKAQQHADTVVIQSLIASAMADLPLSEAWNHQMSDAVVEEQLHSQGNQVAAESLSSFKSRLSYWNDQIKSLSAGGD